MALSNDSVTVRSMACLLIVCIMYWLGVPACGLRCTLRACTTDWCSDIQRNRRIPTDRQKHRHTQTVESTRLLLLLSWLPERVYCVLRARRSITFSASFNINSRASCKALALWCWPRSKHTRQRAIDSLGTLRPPPTDRP